MSEQLSKKQALPKPFKIWEACGGLPTKYLDIWRATARRIEIVIVGPVVMYFSGLDYDGYADEKIASLSKEHAVFLDDAAYWRRKNNRKAKIIDKPG